MTGRIHLSAPDVTEHEERAVARAVASGWVAPVGPDIDAFEAEIARRSDRAHCVALSSGTAALHLGLLVLGVGPGDVVITSTMTFAATANAIVYTGAQPVFVDCDESGNLDPHLLAEVLEGWPADRRIGALVPVDLGGKVADQERIGALAATYGIPVLSDAAESFGATRGGAPAASYGAAAVVSFNGNKIMTTSGGGALLTDDRDLAQRVRYLSTQARQPAVHYEHTDVGFNYRMSNVLAALGRAQLARLPGMLRRRERIRDRYRTIFADVPGVTLLGEPNVADAGATRDNCWLTSILIEPEQAGFTSAELRLALDANDIESRPLWKPMHLQPVFSAAPAFLTGTAERLYATGLSLPSGSGLTGEELARVDTVILDFLEGRRAI